jgi:hypothetical protein
MAPCQFGDIMPTETSPNADLRRVNQGCESAMKVDIDTR